MVRRVDAVSFPTVMQSSVGLIRLETDEDEEKGGKAGGSGKWSGGSLEVRWPGIVLLLSTW